MAERLFGGPQQAPSPSDCALRARSLQTSVLNVGRAVGGFVAICLLPAPAHVVDHRWTTEQTRAKPSDSEFTFPTTVSDGQSRISWP